jgi:hypothetical protein
MRKLILATLVATAGCAVGNQPQDFREGVAATRQADTDDDHGRNIPTLRKVVPGTGQGSGTGNGMPTTGWTPLTNQPTSMYAGTPLLLTDGTVMVQDAGSPNWWKLTPDNTGSYRNGTWTQLAPMPDGYAPLYFASAVLPDGRVIVEGGEYQAFSPNWGTRGAIYDPTKDQWTSIAPPAGWSTIGDAQSVVLADGRFLLANCCTTDAAILDPNTLTWTPFGTGKADIYDEEGWTLLPNGKVLTIDANNTTNMRNSEILNPTSGVWSSAGDTIVQLADLDPDGGGSHEFGPTLVRPDGTVWAVGATGHTGIYKPSTGKWSVGPDFPVIAGQGQLDVADGPASLLPNGKVLVAASAGIFNSPVHFLEFDGTSLVEVGAPPGSSFDSSYNTNLLPLPNGEILMTDFSNDVEIYTPTGKAKKSWAPVIDNGCSLATITAGATVRLEGTRLNGLSQGVAYGDDVQSSTNYPIVRITNRASGHVVYARTHDHSSMGISANINSHTFFEVPATAEKGDSDLVVVANGIASTAVSTTIQ